jgi:hypothetical protein
MAGGYFKQNLRASSRKWNARCGGDGGVTFSAGSYDLVQRGSITWGPWRVQFVDSLPFNGPGHCYEAWVWHLERGLVEDVTAWAKVQTVLPPSLAGPPPKGA